MVMNSQSLSIVIVNRNTRELLEQLLGSIYGDPSLEPLLREVIVVDNGSTDGSGSMVRDRFPSALLRENSDNQGFARAVNQGWRRALGAEVFFLNSDILLPPGETGKILDYMESHPDTGICAPQLVYPDMRTQRSFAHAPRLLFEVIPRSLLERILPGRYPPSKPPPDTLDRGSAPSARDVDSVIGAAMMVRRKVLEVLEGFDERFFFFLEETDLCVRARKKGYGVKFVPHSRVIHHQGKTVRKNWILGRMEYNISLHKFIRKHHGRAYGGLFAATRFLKALFAVAGISLLPFLLVKARTRLSYGYYCRLVGWYLRGLPEDGGLRANSRERR